MAKPFLHLEQQGSLREGSYPGYQSLSLVFQEALDMCWSCLQQANQYHWLGHKEDTVNVLQTRKKTQRLMWYEKQCSKLLLSTTTRAGSQQAVLCKYSHGENVYV